LQLARVMRASSMLPIVFAAAGSAAAPAFASPELALGEGQLALAPRYDALRDHYFDDASGEWVRLAAFAQLTGGAGGSASSGARGDIGVGGAVAVAGLGCDLVHLGGQARLGPVSPSPVISDGRYAICLSRVFMTVTFEGRRGMGLVPTLDARRSLWNRRYDLSYDRIGLAGGELWSNPRHRHTVLAMELGHGELIQADALEQRRIAQLDTDVSVYRYRRVTRDTVLRVDALVLFNEAVKAGTGNRGGVASGLAPLRVRYQAPDRYVAAQAGWAKTGGQVIASGSTEVNGQVTSSWSETINGDGLPELVEPVGSAEAGVRLGEVDASARVARGFFPTFDGNLAREARISGSVSYVPRQRTRVTLAPFAARTRTWTREAGSSVDLSAGASLHVGRDLHRQLRIDAIGEAGLSPYARAEGDRLGPGALGGQVLIALSSRVSQ
jgi:hypothetical protein